MAVDQNNAPPGGAAKPDLITSIEDKLMQYAATLRQSASTFSSSNLQTSYQCTRCPRLSPRRPTIQHTNGRRRGNSRKE